MSDHLTSWLRAQTLTLVLIAAACGCAEVAAEGDEADTPIWPKRVTLRSDDKFTGERVRLADGRVSMNDGDLMLNGAMVISLGSPSEAPILCERGGHASLADVPADTSSCESRWVSRVYLSADSPHTASESDGKDMGLLVRDPTSGAIYRMRLLGDAHDGVEASVTFDYEPVP